MTFAQAQAYLLGTINETASRRVPNRLDRMRALLAALGNPQDQYPTVHVGGTSGKGSTSMMIAAAFNAAGKKTGLHTKPHLTTVTERARIDGVSIDPERFGDILGDMMPAIEEIANDQGRASYYETLLAIAFVYFAQEQVDVAVIEVGIGGTLDGTNVLHPLVSVITNVALDHMEILGDTPAAIAADKVGIAKHGVPLVSDVSDLSARTVIEQGCARAGAPFLSVRDLVRIEPYQGERYGQSFAVITPADRYELSLPVLGDFQQRNAATAILALEQLPSGLRPDRGSIETAFSRLIIPGRMEYFPSYPAVIFDIAHNPDKAQHLADALRHAFPERRFSFVIAVAETKDAGAIIAPFADMPATFTFTSFETEGRVATRPQRLASLASELGIWGRAVTDPVDAISIARRNADADDIVVVTGSTFVVSTLRDWWLAHVASSV
jgi:dihydrofolate synthase / folylpolyglutamate synthase